MKTSWRGVEHRVSVNSARTVAAALREAGHSVIPLGVAQDGEWLGGDASEAALVGLRDELSARGGSIAASLQHLYSADVDVVFPVVHGTWGEDGTLQGLCEMMALPYVGAGVTASALAMDKVLCKRQLAACGVPVVEFHVIRKLAFRMDREACLERISGLTTPLFVKPSCGGSSVGVRRVERYEDLGSALRFAFRFDDTVLVERGIVGRELECSVLGDERLEASAIGEIVPGNDFYDYPDKYLQDTAKLLIPADLSDALATRVRRAAVEAFAAIGGWGMARIDFLLEGDDDLYVNEINTLPGFTRISMYPKLWQESGLALPDLVDRLVAIALSRHERRQQLDEAIKGWLQEIDRRTDPASARLEDDG
ncbi:MAG: D-alanine--D-alanine ligase [Acidobacteriota bacterium]